MSSLPVYINICLGWNQNQKIEETVVLVTRAIIKILKKSHTILKKRVGVVCSLF